MIIFTDERVYNTVDYSWQTDNHYIADEQLEINQQLFSNLMGWA